MVIDVKIPSSHRALNKFFLGDFPIGGTKAHCEKEREYILSKANQVDALIDASPEKLNELLMKGL